jgi:hypothetical protein
VNEIADSPAGVTQQAIAAPLAVKADGEESRASSAAPAATASSSPAAQVGRLSVATIRRDGKVEINEAKDFQEVR